MIHVSRIVVLSLAKIIKLKLLYIISDGDPVLSQFMVKAEQRGRWMVYSLIKAFAVGIPITITIECIANFIYSSIVNDSVDPAKLYRPFRFV